MDTYSTQPLTETVTDCRNCGNKVDENFCSRCGQPATLKRINGHYIIHEIEHVLHFERGILYTVKSLLLTPGQAIKGFFVEDRNRLVKPIIFIIVTSAIYSLISSVLHIEDGYVKFSEQNPSITGSIFKWIQSHYGYGNLLMGAFIALWLKLLFRKFDYNFFEILIALCFVMGMGMLVLAVFAILEKLTKTSLMQVGSFIFIIYASWAIGQFYDKQRKTNYLKAFVAYILGMISFMLVALVIGITIDFAVNKNKGKDFTNKTSIQF
ncbi:zinc ribbon domain-containing protein [Spirosoma soli]|uniref:Zinc ribbon domain-containing protein n=1 Tax=Spirosoma soli TaxID=1770529 RepID=A0ABW5M0U0_9BACT